VWTGEFTGYFTVLGTALDSIKGTFVSASGGSTFMSISVRATEDAAITDFIVALRQWCADYQQTQVGTALATGSGTGAGAGPVAATTHYTVGVTGLGALFYDVLNGSEKDMIKMDAIVLPLALAVLGFFLARFGAPLLFRMNVVVKIQWLIFMLSPCLHIDRNSFLLSSNTQLSSDSRAHHLCDCVASERLHADASGRALRLHRELDDTVHHDVAGARHEL
jgi:hypothetical protein